MQTPLLLDGLIHPSRARGPERARDGGPPPPALLRSQPGSDGPAGPLPGPERRLHAAPRPDGGGAGAEGAGCGPHEAGRRGQRRARSRRRGPAGGQGPLPARQRSEPVAPERPDLRARPLPGRLPRYRPGLLRQGPGARVRLHRRPGHGPRGDPSALRGRGVGRARRGRPGPGTPVGRLRMPRPVLYQDADGARREVSGGYRLEGRHVGFAVGPYDPKRPRHRPDAGLLDVPGREWLRQRREDSSGTPPASCTWWEQPRPPIFRRRPAQYSPPRAAGRTPSSPKTEP